MAKVKIDIDGELKKLPDDLSAQEIQLAKQRIALQKLAYASAKNVFRSQSDLWLTLTHIAATVLGVERAEVWLYDNGHTKIIRHNLYTLNESEEIKKSQLSLEKYPAFFKTISKTRVLVLDDALNNTQISELVDEHVTPFNISSMLMAPIIYGDNLIGIIMLAHVGEKRKWFTGEQNFIASMADISAMCLAEIRRRKTRNQLKEASTELKMQKLAMDKHAIVSVSDCEGVIIDVNDKFCQVSQFTKKELIGKSHSVLNADFHDDDFFRNMWDTITKGEIWHDEICNKRKDGEYYWVDTSIVPFRDSSGKVYKYVAIRTEISELKQVEMKLKIANERLMEKVDKQVKLLRDAQEQLVQSEKLASIGQLSAGVAHEINNPVGYVYSNLGSLKNYVDDLISLLDEYSKFDNEISQNENKFAKLLAIKKEIDIDYLKEDLNELIGESQEGIKRVKQIVQDLKDFSHVETVEATLGDLHKGLNSTLNIVQNEIKYKAEIIQELGELPEVECVHSQINQIFTNLLVNAGHAIEESGTITIRSGVVDEDNVWISVEDTGKGIEEKHLTKIFDPFFTTKPVGKGTGLGLSLSYGIVQNHGGELKVESKVGKGTKFTLFLPVKSISN